MLRVVRRGDRHDARDLTVSIRFEGEFATAFLEGRGDGIIPGETLKSLVHQIVREHAGGELEVIGLALRRRAHHPSSGLARPRRDRGTTLEPHGRWRQAAGTDLRARRSRAAHGDDHQQRPQTAVVAGIDNLTLMRPPASPVAPRRPAARRWGEDAAGAARGQPVGEVDLQQCRRDVRAVPSGAWAAIAETFAVHAARSVQHTLYAIADVVLATYEEILDITLSMHERPYRPADLFSAQAREPRRTVRGGGGAAGRRGSHGGARLLATS